MKTLAHRCDKLGVLLAAVALLQWPSLAALAAPAKDARPAIGLMKVSQGAGLTPAQASTVEELLLLAFDQSGRFKVIGRSDIAALVNFEMQRQAAGCDNDSCLAEVAGALGVDFVGTADVGRLGDELVMTVKVISVRTASVVARAKEIVHSDSELAAATDRLASEVEDGLMQDPEIARRVAATAHLPRAAKAAPVKKSVVPRRLGWVATAVGIAALAVGTGLGVASRLDSANARKTPPADGSLSNEVNRINSESYSADALWGVGGVLGLGGVGLVVAF